MELLYYWLKNDGRTIENQGFIFSGRWYFHLEFQSDLEATLEIKEYSNYIPNFFDTQKQLFTEKLGDKPKPLAPIINVTAVVGNNGVGKTNLFHEVIKILTHNITIGEKYVLALYDFKKNEIQVLHSLESTSITIVTEINNVAISKPKTSKVYEYEPDLSVEWVNTYEIPNSSVIYYNPAFDLRGYPPRIPNDSKDYIDVSTSALIHEDNPYPEVSNYEFEDKVLTHKYSNIRRNIELSFNSHLANDITRVNIPKEFVVICQRYFLDLKDHPINLTGDADDIFKHLESLIDPEFLKVNSSLRPDEKKGSKISDEEYNLLMRQKVKIEFSFCLIRHYFGTLIREYMVSIGVKLSDLVGTGLIERTLDFFEKQKVSKTASILLHSIFENIDKTDYNSYTFSGSTYNKFSSDNIGILIILSNYINYMYEFPKTISSRREFLNIDWRDISSGEKIKLDLYSRLLAAKKKISVGKSEVIYILIDEGELGFHPEWQKEYFKGLMDFVWSCFMGSKVQMFIASHSPFILSDIPKNNVIFLQKKDGKCFVHDIDREETFASNIHTLFTDSFFLNDGLLGDFSKNKVEQLIKRLEELDNDEAERRNLTEEETQLLKKSVLMIGEPVLQEKLLELLEDVINFESLDEKINRLARELSEAKDLKKIKGKNND